MKIAIRVAVFVLGASLLFFAFHKAHNEVVNLQSSSSSSTSGSSEVLGIVGGFLALAAFAPSSETLGKWMSLKRRKTPTHARFRRRHRT